MAVLVLGASGFIGSAVVARLAERGVPVLAVARSGATVARPSVGWARLDLRQATDPQTWTPLLDGVEAVVNCAGVLQDGPRDANQAVHHDAPAALFTACAAAGVKRVIQVSAMGGDRPDPTPFMASKRAGDQALMASELDWVILRPSVVVGRSAYGGSALLRGLAALPFAVDFPGTGRLQVVQLDEVVDTIIRCLESGAPAKVVLELAGPERLTLLEVVACYRAWLGWRPAWRLSAPVGLMAAVSMAGDLAGALGWRSPVRSTARAELALGSTGDPGPWMELTGIAPKRLADALAAEPAAVQERWFARLYLLKPVAFAVLAAFWIGTGVISLGPGFAAGKRLLEQGGAGVAAAALAVVAGLADVAIGAAIAWRPTAKAGLWAALAISVLYMVGGTVMMPTLWGDPLGPLWKVWPTMLLAILALAVLDER